MSAARCGWHISSRTSCSDLLASSQEQKIDAEGTTGRGSVTIKVSSCSFTITYSIKLLKVQFRNVMFRSSPWLRNVMCEEWFFFPPSTGTIVQSEDLILSLGPRWSTQPCCGFPVALQCLCWRSLRPRVPHHSGCLESWILCQKTSVTWRIRERNVWMRKDWRTVQKQPRCGVQARKSLDMLVCTVQHAAKLRYCALFIMSNKINKLCGHFAVFPKRPRQRGMSCEIQGKRVGFWFFKGKQAWLWHLSETHLISL